MTEDKQLFLFGHTLPGNENLLLERLIVFTHLISKFSGLKNAQKNEIKAIALLCLDVQCFEKFQLKMFCKLLLDTIMLPSYSRFYFTVELWVRYSIRLRVSEI